MGRGVMDEVIVCEREARVRDGERDFSMGGEVMGMTGTCLLSDERSCVSVGVGGDETTSKTAVINGE